MRKQDRNKNIEQANLVLEQSYLKSKGLLKEDMFGNTDSKYGNYGVGNKKLNVSDVSDSILTKFCFKFNISIDDLYKRKYIVDNSEPVTLLDFLEINRDAVMANDIIDLDNYIPVKEILNLEVGETYYSGGMGADVERIS